MMRISLGLASLTMSLLLAAHALGLLPDRDGAVLAGRKALCESLAISSSLAAQNNDLPTVRATIRAVAERNPDVRSIALRAADGTFLAQAGEAPPPRETAAKFSTATQMHVPITLNHKLWGTLEVRYRPLAGHWLADYLGGSMLPLLAFMVSTGFVATRLYLGRVFRHTGGGHTKVVPQRVKDTLNTVMEGVLVLDRDQRIALANDAFARTVGVPADTLRGRRASELGWVPARADADDAGTLPWMHTINDGTARRGDVLGLRAGRAGVRKVSVNSTSIMGDDGSCRGALATFDDLTPIESKNAQLRKLLDRLKRAQARTRRQKVELARAKCTAEAASRSKSEFLANVSHEIRTPMNAILGMTEAALETQLGADQREYLDIVKVSADSLLSIIDDILDLSKIEAGKLQLDPIDFRLDDAIGDTLKTLALRCHKKGLELICDIRPDVPLDLHGDPMRLRQVIVNLVGNAVKFTERGEIGVRISVESVDGTDTRLHFAVSDSGIGIPADKLSAIFDPFTQADGSTTRKYGGTGLGLTISARLVGMMGGKIWVESEPGKGSVFHFITRFPAARGATGPRRVPEGLDFARGLPVLVVDDNASSRAIIKDWLEHLGMVVSLAEDGPAALDRLAAAERSGTPLPLALIDAAMPGMSGFTLARKMQLQGSTTASTIFLLSTNDFRSDMERVRELGGAGYLTKPFKQADLWRVLAGVFGERIGDDLGRDDLDARASTPHDRGRAAITGKRLRVLLVDDNTFNQKVGIQKLEKLGYSVRVASNGREAVAATEEQRFDLVFMDVQMSEMDGLEATAAIRAREDGLGRRTPIIAMTARAMVEDRKRCLEAGMDSFVSKPIRDTELHQAIEDVLRNSTQEPVETSEPVERRDVHENGRAQGQPAHESPAAIEQPGGFDKDSALERVGGNVELLDELITVFLTDAPKLIMEIEGAIDRGHAKDLDRAAHTIKSMLSFFNATNASDTALQLELMGKNADLTHAPQQFSTLMVEIDRLLPLLSAISEERKP